MVSREFPVATRAFFLGIRLTSPPVLRAGEGVGAAGADGCFAEGRPAQRRRRRPSRRPSGSGSSRAAGPGSPNWQPMTPVT
jgi:hypothetical protein